MKKSAVLRHIIREEIKKLNEGSDWILLQSIKNLSIDSWSGNFFNHRDLTDPEYEPDSKEWKVIYKKLSSKDKKIVDSVLEDR